VRALSRDALTGPVLAVAEGLLGAQLVRRTTDGVIVLRLTEVEAYAGEDDPGSHAFRGRTPRTAVMFGPAGHAYVYFTYGMHYCCNVVCGPEGSASAVLLRAGQVTDGLDVARARRAAARRDRDLARGPARLCQALGIAADANGHDLRVAPLTLTLADEPVTTVRTGPRVGLRHAADRPWRFWVADDDTVSTYRPAVRRPATP
jgi:DNA-3-methyladenine glycosylase